MQRCPQCDKEYSDEANFCPIDAATLVPMETAASSAGDGLVGGRFRLGEQIGGGRTGAVYRAVDEQDGNTCVLKLVSSTTFATPLVLQRCERELKKLASLNEPGLANVLAHGRTGNDVWVASEAVAGVSLQQLVAGEGALLPNAGAELIGAVGDCLAAVAKSGVVHRDLAPKNILVGDELTVKLINFSLPVPPTTGNAAGVLEYVAPEQLMGKPVDQRSNIYSLGALYYFVLTGRAPTPGQAPANVDSVSAQTNAVLQKSLEQSSSKRYMTLRQLLREIASAAKNDAGSTQPMGQAGKSNKKRELKQTLMGGFAVVEGAVVASAAGPVAAGTIGGNADSTADAASAQPDVNATSMGHSGVQDAQAVSAEAEPVSEPPPSAGATLGGLPAAPPVSSIAMPEESLAATMSPAESAAVTGSLAKPTESASLTAPASKRAVSQAAALSSGADAVAKNVQANDFVGAGAAGVSSSKTPDSSSAPSSPKVSSNPGGKKGKRKSAENKKRRRSAKNKFRETMWFKKGQLDAEAANRAAGDSAKKGLPESDKADEMPMEDRYGDDGSLSHEDADKFSLRTGHTEMMEAITDQPVSGGVSEDDLMREMQGGRGKYIAAIVGGLGLLVVLIVVLSTGGGTSEEDEDAKEVDAAPVAKKQPVKKPIKKAPTVPTQASKAIAGFSTACNAKKGADAWVFLRPELQKRYNDIANKNRRKRRWLRKQGYKGKWNKFTGALYFGTVVTKDTKWSPCHGSDKWDVKGVKIDKDAVLVSSAATAGPTGLVFAKDGDKWLLAEIKKRK